MPVQKLLLLLQNSIALSEREMCKEIPQVQADTGGLLSESSLVAGWQQDSDWIACLTPVGRVQDVMHQCQHQEAARADHTWSVQSRPCNQVRVLPLLEPVCKASALTGEAACKAKFEAWMHVQGSRLGHMWSEEGKNNAVYSFHKIPRHVHWSVPLPTQNLAFAKLCWLPGEKQITAALLP